VHHGQPGASSVHARHRKRLLHIVSRLPELFEFVELREIVRQLGTGDVSVQCTAVGVADGRPGPIGAVYGGQNSARALSERIAGEPDGFALTVESPGGLIAGAARGRCSVSTRESQCSSSECLSAKVSRIERSRG